MKTLLTIAILALGLIVQAQDPEIPKDATFKLIGIKDGPVISIEMSWTPKKKMNTEKKIFNITLADDLAKNKMDQCIVFLKKTIPNKKIYLKKTNESFFTGTPDKEIIALYDRVYDHSKGGFPKMLYDSYRYNNKIMLYLPNGKRIDEVLFSWLIAEAKKDSAQEKEYNDKLQAGKL